MYDTLTTYFGLQRPRVSSGFRRDVDEISTPLEYYAALSGNSVLTFRDNLSVPSSRVKKSKKKMPSWPLKMGAICWP
jgi:hypothetical protein